LENLLSPELTATRVLNRKKPRVRQLTLLFKNRVVTSGYQPGVSVNELSEYLRNRRSGINFWRKRDFSFRRHIPTDSVSYRNCIQIVSGINDGNVMTI